MFDSADLRGHQILIVESDACPCAVALQAAIPGLRAWALNDKAQRQLVALKYCAG
jgi:hypothetical protein